MEEGKQLKFQQDPCIVDFQVKWIFKDNSMIPYFFGYKTEFISVQNNPKDLDPSCKMDLDLWGCLGRAKLVL